MTEKGKTMTHAYELPNRMDVPGDHKHTRSGDPILRATYTDNGTRQVYACGGLHYLRGNSAPYFSLTIESYRIVEKRREEDTFGQAHEELVALWPELAPLAALHLSDWYGVPMHAEANGWYQLAGYGGGLGERYHAGNATHYGPEETPEETRARCLRQWAEHVRLPIEEAKAVAYRILTNGAAAARATGYETEPGVTFALRAVGRETRKLHAAWIETQRPRWQREADECMRALGIAYYYGERIAPKVAANG